MRNALATIGKTSTVVALVLLVSFALLSTWLPWDVALRLTVGAPFLYVLPGYWLARTFLPSRDRVETAVTAVLLSFVFVHLGIFLVEEVTKRLTRTHILLVVAAVNLLTFVLSLAVRRRARRSPHARLSTNAARELDERDEEESEDESNPTENHERLVEHTALRRPRELGGREQDA